MEPKDPETLLVIELATGRVVIELLPEVAPLHVERVKTLARAGEYDNVAFHRVLEGFVAQAGDVRYGDLEDGYDPFRVGTGGSDLPNLPPEFSDLPFERGVVGMARAQAFDSANSQFFIMYGSSPTLNGLYTVFGEVILGMRLVDGLKRGVPPSGRVVDPDRMIGVDVVADLGPEDGIGQGISVAAARQVALLYEAGLDRDGNIDLPGLNFWIDARENGLTLRQLADAFLLSDEFEASFGDPFDTADPRYLDDEAYVRALFENVLDRAADQPGLDFWRSVLDRPDFDRQQLLIAFADSRENLAGSPIVESLEEAAEGVWLFLA